MTRSTLTRYAWLSIAAALVTIGLKVWAWGVTGSVGLLSDALESLVNLAAAIFALMMLTIAARPPDDEHMFGHDKAEYFAGGVEGGLILLAAIGIAIPATNRLLDPIAIERIDLGLPLSALASIVNLVVARILLKVGRAERSMTLEADGRHLMTDVWTSIGVVIGVGLSVVTGVKILDPLIGLALTLYIAVTGIRLLRRSAHGLMDLAVTDEDRAEIESILADYEAKGISTHALRTRQSGGRSFIYFHVLVPGAWSVQQGHDLVEEMEERIRAALPAGASIFTHLEPEEDPLSWDDTELTRKDRRE